MTKLKLLSILIFLLGISTIINGQSHWESLILESDTFNYLVPESAPTTDWIQLSYDDASWDSGIGGFGYADGDDNTVIATPTTSVYLRKTLNMPASVSVLQFVLDIDYDDAFVAYINGIEVARSQNLEPGTPKMDGSVTMDHEAQMYLGGLPERFILNPATLNEGSNIIAVHIMNYSISSTDLSARVFLSAELDSDQIFFHATPAWFRELVSYESSNLPIIKINTEGGIIVDEPKIMARMQVINNADSINRFNDTVYEYDGYIGVEIRGNTSQMFEKKSYGIETRLISGENNNVSLLGMPSENDWVFHGPYSDKSLMRNALAYYIGNTMGKGWHPKTRFIELVINDEYRGVYLVTEKIKIDKNRVNIAKLKSADTTGNELTGGYIISIDRDQVGSWNSPFMGRTGSVDVPFSYVDPKYDELTTQQRNYIRNYITDFEYALDGSNYKDPQKGYRAFIDITTFIDYFIITELSKDLDGYRVSVFFHKDKDSKDARLKMTPFWDYNLCFGNGNFFSAGNPEGWASDGIGAGDAYEIPFWWDKFRTDPYFETLLKYRWQELRRNFINITELNKVIESMANSLLDAQARNFEKFDILSTYVWPNYYVGGTYENEVDYLKGWFDSRITWMDSEIAKIVPISLSFTVLETLSATNLTLTSSTLNGKISNDGGAYIWEKGFYWSADIDPVENGKKIKTGAGSENFTTNLTGLTPNTEYYFVAYAKNDIGTTYGKKLSFITEFGVIIPTVLTLEAENITDSSASVGGNVISNGGADVIERGIYYHTETSPELFGTKVIAKNDNEVFTVQLNNLAPNQEYFITAYAINSEGTSYGETFSFITTNGLNGSSFADAGYKLFEQNIVAYPNPFSENVTIKMDLEYDCQVEISIINTLGKIINTLTRHCMTGTNQFFLNENNFESNTNIYFYNVLIDGMPMYRGKLVKH